MLKIHFEAWYDHDVDTLKYITDIYFQLLHTSIIAVTVTQDNRNWANKQRTYQNY